MDYGERAVGLEFPKNIEAEQLVLGCVLLNPEESMSVLGTKLSPDAFFLEKHRLIYRTMLDLSMADKPATIFDVSRRLEELGQVDDAGGRLYLNDLLSTAASVTSLDHYAQIITEKHVRRSAITLAHRVAEVAGMESETLDAIQAEVDDLQDAIASKESGGIFDLSAYVSRAIPLMLDSLQTGFSGLPSGLANIDKLLKGFRPGIYVIGGRPGMGKTTLAVDIAYRMSEIDHPKDASRKIKPGILSLEMKGEDLAMRLLSRALGREWDVVPVTSSKARQASDILQVSKRVEQQRIVIDDRPHASIQRASASAHEMIVKHKIDILFVDYVQLLGDSESNDNREQELAAVMRRFVRLRKRFDIPIVVLAQLNRKCEDRADKRPILSDLRESGSIEQDADAVMFVFYPPAHNIDGEYEVICAKNRHGSPGTAFLHWERGQFTFKDSTFGVRLPSHSLSRQALTTPQKNKESREWDGQ